MANSIDDFMIFRTFWYGHAKVIHVKSDWFVLWDAYICHLLRVLFVILVQCRLFIDPWTNSLRCHGHLLARQRHLLSLWLYLIHPKLDHLFINRYRLRRNCHFNVFLISLSVSLVTLGSYGGLFAVTHRHSVDGFIKVKAVNRLIVDCQCVLMDCRKEQESLLRCKCEVSYWLWRYFKKV